MSPKAPRFTGRAFIKALGKHEFSVSRIRGSHHFCVTKMDGLRLFRFIVVKRLGRGYWQKYYETVN